METQFKPPEGKPAWWPVEVFKSSRDQWLFNMGVEAGVRALLGRIEDRMFDTPGQMVPILRAINPDAWVRIVRESVGKEG
ncbi:MAG: hypothetical protein Q7O66_13820 [Dehalococcoidia bacterium]|nr:hypothetical protein [Dehalococcoidia bacterium]